jgi:hypothetical protein
VQRARRRAITHRPASALEPSRVRSVRGHTLAAVAWRITLIVGAVLAVACAGLALYVEGQPSESRCEETRPLGPGDAGYTDPTDPAIDPEFAEFRNEIGAICVSYADAPLPILRSGTRTWWWFVSVAIAVLTLASIPLLRGGPRVAR